MLPMKRVAGRETRRVSKCLLPAVATGMSWVASCSAMSPGDSSSAIASNVTTDARPSAGTYTIDSAHTFINFAAQHKVVGRVHGRFERMNGTIAVAHNAAASSIDISIEAGSVTTQNSLRDEHLRSADFFDAIRHPVQYQGQGIQKSGDGWVIDGELTIRGKTNSVPLSFVFMGTAPLESGKPSRVAFHADAAAKRADFGMTYDVLADIGSTSESSDVWILIDAELLGAGHDASAGYSDTTR